ncbi:serine protease inhibitor dipetalogastin-like [Saccostrea echinata]|uniref:serine protease inhibitor dipetalogastin-like n=1 Tax=Saccostrea echinata TaxID=191078 RepID=UPI002A82F1B8|nr:serine protease inhibitor dipetalogastin-like [Saccostrea echinata]
MALYLFLLLVASTMVHSQTNNCACIQVYDPVCGINGRTYSNSACAGCAGVAVQCRGECPCRTTGNCACGFIYDPVCGFNGRTYSNSCVARCSGVFFYWRGRCPW